MNRIKIRWQNLKRSSRILFDDLTARRQLLRLRLKHNKIKYQVDHLEKQLARSKKAEADSIADLDRIYGVLKFAKYKYNKVVKGLFMADLRCTIGYIEQDRKEEIEVKQARLKVLAQGTRGIIHEVEGYHKDLFKALNI